jgi:hypothetical protein
MTEMLLDTQKVVDRLVEAGVPPGQARVHASVLADALGSVDGHVREHYATKDAVALATEKVETSIERLRSDLTKWVVTVGILQTAITAGLIIALVR